VAFTVASGSTVTKRDLSPRFALFSMDQCGWLGVCMRRHLLSMRGAERASIIIDKECLGAGLGKGFKAKGLPKSFQHGPRNANGNPFVNLSAASQVGRKVGRAKVRLTTLQSPLGKRHLTDPFIHPLRAHHVYQRAIRRRPLGCQDQRKVLEVEESPFPRWIPRRGIGACKIR
jgi:hypothetical protein